MGAVMIAIVQSIRGEVREFAAAVGFEESVETLLDKVEDKFGEKWTMDELQQDFYKITQGKNEKVRQFTGIDALTTVVKSSSLGGAMPKQNNVGTTPQKMKDNGKNNGNTYKG